MILPAATGEKKERPFRACSRATARRRDACLGRTKEPNNDRPTIVPIFTEKDQSRIRVKAFFGDFGSALMITVTRDGAVVGCDVAHSAHKKSGFSDLGRMKTIDFKLADGKVTGTLTTDGEVDTFGEKWEVKLKFEAKAP